MKKDKYFYNCQEFKDLKEVTYNAVEKNSDLVAFILKEKTKEGIKYKNITFKETLEDINNLGTSLLNLGMKDKKVAVIAKNRYEWFITYMSALLGNMVIIPLDKGLTEVEIENSLVKSKADMIIFEDNFEDSMKNIRVKGSTNLKEYICMDKSEEFKNIYDVIKTGEKLQAEGNKEYINIKIDSDKMSILLFTSGTTSASKAVMLSHKNIVSNIIGVSSVIKVHNTDVYLALLPFHHTLGAIGFWLLFSNGASIAFCDGLRHIQENLKEYKVSVLLTVPLLLENMDKKINKQIEKKGKTKTVKFGKRLSKFLLFFGIDIRRKLFKEILDEFGGGLRYIVSGAASLDRKVAENFSDLGIRTVQGYGLTETSPVIAIENDKYVKYGSVGFHLKDVQVKIENKNEEGIGELVAKGPNIMMGYYEDEEATNEALKDGWFHTGDLGYIDSEEYIFITGRRKNVIVLKNGKNIYPEELESIINKLELVNESMVFGLPKEDDLVVSVKIQYDKEVVKEKYSDMSKEDLEKMVWEQIKEINKEMPKYKYIKNMILTDEEFIKTTTSKIKRFEEIKKITGNK